MDVVTNRSGALLLFIVLLIGFELNLSIKDAKDEDKEKAAYHQLQ